MWLRCPKCRSSRVRRGYEKPALLLRLIGVHGLLCDNCNLSYRGFAFPGTVPLKSKRDYKRHSRSTHTLDVETAQSNEQQQGVKYARRVWPEDEGLKASELISFAWYYVKLRVRVITGQHHTSHSLGIKYRWHNWQHWQRSKR